MRVRTLGALTIGVLLVPLIVSAQAPPPRDRPTTEAPTGTARLRGRVVAADTGSPLRRAQVRAVASAIRTTRLTTTDAEGRYEFVNLPAGRYTISVNKAGYVSLVYPVNPKPGDVTIRFQHNTSPSNKGQFGIGRMPPGEYVGLAVKGVQPGEEWDPELRQHVEQLGKRFTLKEGETLELEVPYVE